MGILRRSILYILANAAALYGAYKFVPIVLSGSGQFFISSGSMNLFFAYCTVGFVLGLLNTLIRPALKVLSLPLVIITMGLFLIVINIVILLLVQYLFNDILTSLQVFVNIIGGWQTTLITAIVLSVFNSITHWLIK